MAADTDGQIDRTDVGRLPNIVWIVCHDIHAPLLGCYGNRLARTPTIDRLARDGIRYDNAFSVSPVCAPSRFSLVTGLYPESCGPAEHMRAVGHVPERFRSLPELMRERGYYATNNVFTDYNCDLDPDRIWDECSITAHWRGRPEGMPFFCVYNYSLTHESKVINFVGEPHTDPGAVTVPPYLPDRPDIRRDLAANVDILSRQDEALAKLLGQLEADGLADSTIVFFLADHGGVAPRSKRYCYEEGLRVPLIVRVPEAFAHLRDGLAAGASSRQVVSLVDLAPTVLELAGAVIPDEMTGVPFLGRVMRQRTIAFSGRNRMDERYDMVRTARNDRYRYIRNYAPHRVHGLHNAYEWQLRSYQAWERAFLDGELDDIQSRFWREKPAEELYDIEVDPHELHNLAGNPAHAARLNAFAQALDDHMLAIGDEGFVPEGVETIADGTEFLDTLTTVLPLARTAIARRVENAELFVEALGDANVVVRFWAAQGLAMLRDPVSNDVRDAVRRQLTAEDDPHVRCAIAEAFRRIGDVTEAVGVLSALLQERGHPRLTLQVLEALTYLPVDAVRPLRVAIEAAGAVDEYTRGAAAYLVLRIDGTYVPESRTFTFEMPKDPAILLKIGDPRIGD